MAKLFLALAMLFAIGTALAQPMSEPASGEPAAKTEQAPEGGGGGAALPAPTSGLSPMPGDAKVPLAFLPPGAFVDDSGPSAAIFPVQNLTLRFNHKFHVGTQRRRASR
jgi:hypothetical protein